MDFFFMLALYQDNPPNLNLIDVIKYIRKSLLLK